MATAGSGVSNEFERYAGPPGHHLFPAGIRPGHDLPGAAADETGVSGAGEAFVGASDVGGGTDGSAAPGGGAVEPGRGRVGRGRASDNGTAARRPEPEPPQPGAGHVPKRRVARADRGRNQGAATGSQAAAESAGNRRRRLVALRARTTLRDFLG